MLSLKLRKRRKRAAPSAADLDVTPFMNLMIVLVPVLLLSMVFAHTTVLDLHLPAEPSAVQNDSEPPPHLEVHILANGLTVADERQLIRHFPLLEGRHDLVGLQQLLRDFKARYPLKRDALLLLEEDTSYQTLIAVMDSVRSYAVLQHQQWEQAELFPEIGLGDVPPGNGAGKQPDRVGEVSGPGKAHSEVAATGEVPS